MEQPGLNDNLFPFHGKDCKVARVYVWSHVFNFVVREIFNGKCIMLPVRD